jgi:hypothetical protein
MTKANIGNSQAVIKIGRNTVLKAYRGSNILYNPISVPSSPTNIIASLSGKDAIISFSASSSNGGSAITNYIVQYSSNNGTSWTTFDRANSTATSNITVNTLSYNRSYIFRAIAVNSIGDSNPSNSSSSITTPPGIVGNLYGQFKRGGEPSDAEMLAGNFLSTPLSSPSLYSSIDYGENDDNYGFMAIGYFIPPTTGTYTFYTSSDDGSAVWVGSIAEATSGRSSSNMVVNNSVTGYQGDTERSGSISLIAGTVYAVRIIHREGGGGDNLRFSWDGPNISKRTSLATYFYASNFGSEPPEILSVSVDPLNSYLRITPVLSSSNVTYFTISYSSNNGNSWTVFGNGQTAYASSVDITGLTNGVNYKIKITATNSIGTSEEYITENYSPNANAVTPLSLANGFLSALRTDTISDSEFSNAALTNGYLSVLRVNDTISEAEFPNAVLANGYLSVLRSNDTISEAEFSNAVLTNGYLGVLHNDSITYNTVNAPTNLTATSVELDVILNWTAPNNTSSSLMSNYIVEYTPSGGSPQTVNTNSGNTSYTITGLTSGTSYTFRVAGVNNGSIGTYTDSSNSVTIPNIPSAPQSLTASPTCCGPRINVNWSAPTSNGGFAITGYRVQISGGGFSINQVVSGTSFASPDNGDYGGSATVSVRAINSAGESPLTSTNVSWDFGN